MVEEEKTKKKKKKKKKMSKQDFQVRVHIIECRDLKGVDRRYISRKRIFVFFFKKKLSSGMSDPVVFVECLGEKQETDIEKQTTSASFDRLML